MLVALPVETHVFNRPDPPAMVRFWNPKSSTPTVQGVTTLPALTEPPPEPELNLDHLQLSPTASEAVKARIKIGKRLEFRAGDGDLVAVPALPRSIASFQHVYSMPRPMLARFAAKANPRLRLLPPYREHVSHSFGRYFSRIGLLQDIPRYPV